MGESEERLEYSPEEQEELDRILKILPEESVIESEMKIAISSTQDNLEGDVDQRFGRCKFFLLIDLENMAYDTIENESTMVSGGAGIKAAEMIVRNGANIVITGNIGPNAFQTLSSGGIEVYTGARGSIKQSIEQFKKGELQKTENANVKNHAGMNR